MQAQPELHRPPSQIEGLFREHHDRAFRAAYRITGNPNDAEDAVQTVFLRLVKRKDQPDLAPSPASYLHRAAVNAALDVVRARSTSRAVHLEEVTLEGSNQDRPDQQLDTTELRDQLRQAIADLPERAGEMFALRYFEGHSVGEVAEMTGTSRGVVAVTLFRTRNRLKKELRSYVGENR